MKVKFFYHRYWESKKDFEKEINDFMATVQVIDVKHSTVTVGDSEPWEIVTPWVRLLVCLYYTSSNADERASKWI